MRAELKIDLLEVTPGQITAAMNQGLLEAGEEIKALASVLAPKDTGELSRSGKVEQTADGVVVSFGNDIDDARAVVQEYGSIFQAAQPYLLPAARAVDVTFFIADALAKILKK